MGKRAQRIPSWPGVIHSNKGRIHLRRPTCDTLTFRLRRRGGPYIPSGRPLAQNIIFRFQNPVCGPGQALVRNAGLSETDRLETEMRNRLRQEDN